MIVKITKNSIYCLSLIGSWLLYLFLFGCDKLNLKGIRNRVSEIIVTQFGQEVIVWRQDYDPVEKEVKQKAILALPSFGCTHYFKRGGCAMCGFNKEIEKYHLRWLHPLALVVLAQLFIIYLAEQQTKRSRAFTLCVFMAGSFFNSDELPPKASQIVIEYFLNSPFKKLFLESRAEYIWQRKRDIKQLSKKFKQRGKQLEIAIGLESSNEKIRNVYINKRLPLFSYVRAVKALKECGVVVNTYILIGAPYLDEKQIVQLAVTSAIFAWLAGSDIVSFEVYCVQAQTKWACFYEKGDLVLPNLWAVLEILRTVDQFCSQWALGDFNDWPPPIARPRGCKYCDKYLTFVLTSLRITHNFDSLFHILFYCQCNQIFKF